MCQRECCCPAALKGTNPSKTSASHKQPQLFSPCLAVWGCKAMHGSYLTRSVKKYTQGDPNVSNTIHIQFRHTETRDPETCSKTAKRKVKLPQM